MAYANVNDKVSYKVIKGRGRPSQGRIVKQKVVCVEIENLNSGKRVFMPMDEIRRLDEVA